MSGGKPIKFALASSQSYKIPEMFFSSRVEGFFTTISPPPIFQPTLGTLKSGAIVMNRESSFRQKNGEKIGVLSSKYICFVSNTFQIQPFHKGLAMQTDVSFFARSIALILPN
jgi:hypothetical protein